MALFTDGQIPRASDFNQLAVAADLADVTTPGKGTGMLRWIRGAIGAVAQSLLRWLGGQEISVFDFMSDTLVADWQAGTLANDMSASIQAAINAANTLGGAVVKLPRGKGRCDETLLMAKRVMLRGEGRQATTLVFTAIGNAILSTWPINSSTAVWVRVRDLGITCSNSGNAGGGFVDVGGTYVDLSNVFITGFRYQAILDQTEIAKIDDCEFVHPGGTTGVWLVNGPDHTSGANTGYTNRITIAHCQFNGASGGLENILDDGGVNHTIRDNNFNGGTVAVRAAGVAGVALLGNESEGHTSAESVLWTNTTKAGAYVGACGSVEAAGNTFYEFTGSIFQIDEIQGGRIASNVFSGGQSQVFLLSNGAANPTTGLVIENNTKVVSGAARMACIWFNCSSLVPYRNIQFRQNSATYVPAALTSAGLQTVTPAAMENIHPGSRIVCQNQDGTNAETVIVTATTTTTFTATFASTKATNWCAYGTTPPNEEEGVWTPTLQGSTTAGSHTAAGSAGKWSRRGNMVRLTGQIAITAKDASMAGNLQIAGLPFTSENVGNQIGTCMVTAFAGFTLPASFTLLGGSVGVATNVVSLLRSGSGVASTQAVAGDIPGTTCSLSFVIDFETQSN